MDSGRFIARGAWLVHTAKLVRREGQHVQIKETGVVSEVQVLRVELDSIFSASIDSISELFCSLDRLQ